MKMHFRFLNNKFWWSIKCILFIVANTVSSCAQTVSGTFALNQAGYYPEATKTALILTDNPARMSFQVVDNNTGKIVFDGLLGSPMLSASSAFTTRSADFTALQQTGSFHIVVKELGESMTFDIRKHIYSPVAVASLKAFYYQRASMPLEPAYAGIWQHKAGHPDTAVIIHPSAAFKNRTAGSLIASPGGWYDAGDYNKYVVNSGISTGTLLAAYEDFSAYFDSLHTNIPESKNALPDILDEALYNIRWLFTMQDPQDGGVYNKCTNASFDGMIMPEKAVSPRYVVQKGTAAALNLSAVMAQSSRLFRKFEKSCPGLADSCLIAAEKAWNWAKENPDVSYDQGQMNKKYEPAITTGGYGDAYFGDEWLWANAELFATTGKKLYFDKILGQMNDVIDVPSWNNVGILGYYTLIRTKKQLPEYAQSIIEIMKKRVISLADSYINKISSNALHSVMGSTRKDYIWGSNAVAANQGVLLINAYLLTHEKKYLDAALGNVDYLLGRNFTGYCFVTGTTTKSPLHPHHRISIADGIPAPVPGLLVGGPNEGRQDGIHYTNTTPEASYIDEAGAYASNEIAINWNAPLVYLLNAADAIMGTI
jgi:endoglucanase